jgi:hypothetical protein
MGTSFYFHYELYLRVLFQLGSSQAGAELIPCPADCHPGTLANPSPISLVQGLSPTSEYKKKTSPTGHICILAGTWNNFNVNRFDLLSTVKI